MKVEGTVQISINDFDELRNKAKSFEELTNKLRSCTKVQDVELTEDDWMQEIKVDAEQVSRLAAEYADVEEIYPGDIIVLTNIKSVTTQD